MPAGRGRFGDLGSRERIPALVAAALVQAALALALLTGLRVHVSREADVVERLIDVQLAPPPRSGPSRCQLRQPRRHAPPGPADLPDPRFTAPQSLRQRSLAPRPLNPPAVAPELGLRPEAEAVAVKEQATTAAPTWCRSRAKSCLPIIRAICVSEVSVGASASSSVSAPMAE